MGESTEKKRARAELSFRQPEPTRTAAEDARADREAAVRDGDANTARLKSQRLARDEAEQVAKDLDKALGRNKKS